MENKMRLIDIGKRMAEWNDLLKAHYPNMPCQTLGEFLLNAPTVDAVEVVRCKDCKGWCSEEIAKQYGVDRYCTMTMMPTNADDFCSYGERRMPMMKCDPMARAQCPHGAYCETFAVFSDESECAKFNQAIQQKPITNADRIRSMSDEELAEFLTEEKWECANYRVCKECPRYIGDCCLPLDEWLKQPAEVTSNGL